MGWVQSEIIKYVEENKGNVFSQKEVEAAFDGKRLDKPLKQIRKYKMLKFKDVFFPSHHCYVYWYGGKRMIDMLQLEQKIILLDKDLSDLNEIEKDFV